MLGNKISLNECKNIDIIQGVALTTVKLYLKSTIERNLGKSQVVEIKQYMLAKLMG